MTILVVCKRHYINHDLIAERYGRLFHLPRLWATHEPVHVVCLDYRGLPAEDREMAGVMFTSLPLGPDPGKLLKAWTTIRAIVDRRRPDMIVASSDIFYGWLGRRLARHSGARWVFDVYDDYRYFPINRFQPSRFLFGGLCSSAAGVLCVSPRLRNVVSRYQPHVGLAENGYDPALFRSGNRDEARAALGLDPAWKIVAHTGSVDDRFDVDAVTGAFNRLHARDPNVRLLLAGRNAVRADFRRAWAIDFGVVEQSRVSRIISAADLCLAPYRRSQLSESCNPCKLAEYLACGRPVLAADVSDLAAYAPFGVTTYDPGDVEALAALAARLLISAPPVRPAEHLAWDSLGQRTYAFIRTVAQSKSP